MASGKESLRQEQQTRLQQWLNPQNVALGRVLEMTTPEFEDEVSRELDENPALEAIDTSENTDATSGDFDDTNYDAEDDHYDHPEAGMPSLQMASGRSYDPSSWTADENDSLYDILMKRLSGESELDEKQLRIAAYIIGNLDSNGYLTRSTEAIIDDLEVSEGIRVSRDELRYVLDEVRSLDPAGIAAFDLRDCLLLQIDRRNPSPVVDNAREIIANYFDLFSKKHYDRLRADMGISREALGDALDLIRSLNPKPASALNSSRTSDRARHIVPDFILDYNRDDDRFTISLTGHIPELAVEQSFAAEPGDDDERRLEGNSSLRRNRNQALAFVRKKRDDALSFIRLVEMRNETLLTIARAIVGLQKAFFISGDPADIRPMILRDLARMTGLDISVISRACAGKYIATPHGVYALKMFFNERPDADTDVSAHQILEALRKIIEAEDKTDPLSDRELTDALAEKGFDIARRTVAKYRERLGLPVARLRKTF